MGIRDWGFVARSVSEGVKNLNPQRKQGPFDIEPSASDQIQNHGER